MSEGLEKFLARLAKTAPVLRWRRSEGFGMLRGATTGGRCCPLTGVWWYESGKFVDTCDAASVHAGLGLSLEEAERVIASADADPGDSHYDAGLRARLLAACGLQEAAP